MISQVFFPIFILFSLQSHIAYTLQSNTSFKIDLMNFNGLSRRGDHSAKLVHELKKRLIYLGYLHANKLGDENHFDHNLEQAVKKYQEFCNLNVTRVVDMSTIASIRKPRCGVPDFFNPQTHFKSLYSFFPGNPRWSKRKLKYQFTERVILDHRRPIVQAMREWQSRTHFQFFRIRYSIDSNADITISFEKGDHGDGYPFVTEVAHAFQPPYGMLHFNANERWDSNGNRNAYDILTVALHELGHVLGLQHSTVENAIMFHDIRPGEIKVLHQDDIDGINALYNL